MSVRVPTIAIPRVYHLGTLDPARRGEGAGGVTSLEGHHVSVSLTPHAWRRIARLGGAPLLRLTRPGARVLDLYAAVASPALQETVTAWGLEHALIVQTRAFQARIQDDDGWSLQDFETEDEAVGAVMDALDLDPDEAALPAGVTWVTPVSRWSGTPALAQLTGMAPAMLRAAERALTIAWAGETTALDGVWWRDVYDPAGHSAPRGLIFNARLGGWAREPAELEDVDDGDGATVPTTRWEVGTP